MPVVALAVTLYLLGRVVDVLLLIILGAGLVGMYLLRRYARAELLYQRLADGRREHPSQPHLEPERNPGRPGRDTGRRPGMRGKSSRPWRIRAHGGRARLLRTPRRHADRNHVSGHVLRVLATPRAPNDQARS